MAATASPLIHSDAGTPGWTSLPPPGFLHPFNRAMNELDLTDGEIRLLELMLSFDLPDPRHGGARKGIVWPGRKSLAENLGIKERTLRKRLAGLKAAGIIQDLSPAELRQLRNQGFDVPHDARRGAWRINYHLLPDLQVTQEESGPDDQPDRATKTGTNVPPPLYTQSENPKDPKQHQESKETTTATDTIHGGDDDSFSPPSEEEPFNNNSKKNIELQTALLGWKVSKPIANRIITRVTQETIHQALSLLQRNQALPRNQRIIINPPGWLCYTLTILDDPQLEAWEQRIAAAEEEISSSMPTTRTVVIEELLPKEQENPAAAPAAPIEPPQVEAAAAPSTPEPVEDAPEDVRKLIQQSFDEAEAHAAPAHMKGNTFGKSDQSAPTFDIQVATADDPGTSASVHCGVKSIEHHYDRLPEVPVDDVFIDPERTMPNPEPHPEVPEEDEPEDNVAALGRVSDSPEKNTETCSHESGHIWEETQPGSTPSDQSEEQMISPTQPHQPWHLDQADCDQLWRKVQNQLEGEQQHLPFLYQVTLNWKGDHVELQSPQRAIAWALENRVDRIQSLLQRLTGHEIEIEVTSGPWESSETVFNHPSGASVAKGG